MPRSLLLRLRRSLAEEPWLWGVIVLTLLLRLPALGYGLPLMLVNDESPFTLAALKMLELHTLVPAFHQAEFEAILYYPPYLSYLYLPFFAVIVGVVYLMHGGTDFVAYLVSDLSPFFLAARAINVGFALVSVYLVYRIGERLFASRAAALATAFLLSTSLLHLSLSVVGRQWLPVSSLVLLALYILTDERLAERRRYLFAMLIAGVGMGFSAITVLLLPLIGLYWWCLGKARLTTLLRDASLWVGALGFLVLAALPSLLYPSSSGFLVDLTLYDPKSLTGFVAIPWNTFRETLYSEPVLMLLGTLGGLALLRRRGRLVAFFTLWVLLYAVVFYVFFRFEPRFLLPIVPLYALLGGYAVVELCRHRLGTVVVCVLLLVPLVASMRLAYLGADGDTRTKARSWTLAHLSPSDSVLVYAATTRVPTTARAVAELRAIDPAAVRQVDKADEALDRELPHALNLFGVADDAFFAELPRYARAHGYTYLLIEPSFAFDARGRGAAFAPLTEGASVLASWQGLGGEASLDASAFPAPLYRLFSGAPLGPGVVIYRLD